MRYYLLLIFLMTVGFTSAHATSLDSQSPVGYWKTTDNITGQPKSIIEIFENNDKTLSGKVVKIFSQAFLEHNKNQLILGIVILSGLKQNKNTWDNGIIFDPINGKSYHCMLRVVSHGKKILVRGYLGLPVFGWSQVWERV